MKIFWMSAAGALVLAGCVGTTAEFGGATAPAEVPSATVACADADLAVDSLVHPVFPPKLFEMIWLSDRDSPLRETSFPYRYDIDAEGQPVNIIFTGDPYYLEHGALRDSVGYGAETLSQWRYNWQSEPPHFATGCIQNFRFNGNKRRFDFQLKWGEEE